MKKYILILFPLFIGLQLSAQYGLNLSYHTFDANNWNKLIGNANIDGIKPIENGFSVGIDRWFKMKNNRIEFFPELNVGNYKADWGTMGKMTVTGASIYVNTSFYIFDMEGDCDCPTFSKDGNVIKKGFFLQVSPGATFASLGIEKDELKETANTITPSIGVGAGIDIGVMDLVTITPFVKYRHHFNANWKDLNKYLANNEGDQEEVLNKSAIQFWQFGIRLGLRLDQGRRRRYR